MSAPKKKTEVIAETEAGLARPRNGKPTKIELPLHRRVDTSLLQYASYVIRDRAIPNLADGLKQVQRRILWSLHEKDDGRFIKVATISGHCAQYHPHGEAAISDALVVLVNKRYLIEGQGNFGNIFTGDPPAAPRYIECRLTELARAEIFNDDLTEFVPSYDGRNKEPVALPSKLPLLLMLGTEGIAVGMSCKILPHNFPELLQAQIAILKKQSFRLLPDFPTGGLMDARDYKDGIGGIKVRAKIKTKDGSTVIIKEIPPTTTTDSLIASIEDAARKGKIKVKSVNDFTSEDVEIEIKAPGGVSAEQLVDALYAFTDCEVTIASRIVVIKNNRPVEMTVSEVLRENTAQLVDTLKRELQLKE
ncbi:MAG: DNA topoisomerase IV subunit A, partial [Verrucomicrobia bacterium]